MTQASRFSVFDMDQLIAGNRLFQRLALIIPRRQYSLWQLNQGVFSMHLIFEICREVSMFCPQAIDEDCLTINVWTPWPSAAEIPPSNASTDALLPVLIFIHGGSFETGGADIPALKASELATALNAIIVTFNYRLSIFGFAGADVAGGDASLNYGILDQRLAISWISANIRDFGGDPSNMTLAGQSAGAMSVLIHLTHNDTRSKFKRVLVMSPPAAGFRTPDMARADFRNLIARAGCSNSSDLQPCLAQRSTRQLLDALDHQQQDLKKGAVRADVILSAILDGNTIPKHPIDIIADSQLMSRVDTIIGSLSNETWKFISDLAVVDIPQPIYNVGLNALFPQAADSLNREYASIGSSATNRSTQTDYRSIVSAIETDHLFVCAPLRNLHQLPASHPSRIFSYLWETPWTGTLDDPVGQICGNNACHTTDVAMLFRSPSDPLGARVTLAFRSFISTYIRTGSPTLQPSSQWPPYNFALQTFPTMRFTTLTSSTPTVLESIHPHTTRCNLMNTIPYEHEQIVNLVISDWTIVDHDGVSIFWTIVVLLCVAQAVVLAFSLLIYRRILALVRLVTRSDSLCGDAKKDYQDDCESTQDQPRDSFEMLLDGDDSGEYGWMDKQPMPIAIECRQLSYRVPDGTNGVKTILEDLSFACMPGSLTALIGPSGAGKTSLISLLARQIVHPEAQAAIWYGGKQLSSMQRSEFQRIVGFVSQHNPPYTGLTITEVLMAYAKLELPKHMTLGQLTQRVMHVIDLLGLTPCANVVIKDASENKGGISGGQLRRIPIAAALLKQPSVLVLDEPTSGLDSRSSLEVMHVLSYLAHQGYTIIVSIHQPRREIFDLFTSLILLAQGRLLFTGDPQECIRFAHAVQTASGQSTRSLALRRRWTEPQQSTMALAAASITAASGSASIPTQSRQIAIDDLAHFNPADTILDVVAAIPRAEIFEAMRNLGSGTKASDTTPAAALHSTAIHIKSDLDRYSNQSSEITQSGHTDANTDPRYTTRVGVFTQMVVCNARWWRRRPLIRKLMMLFITMIAMTFLGLLQRRVEHDVISITLQIKGLAIACVGLAALKNVNISFDFYEDRDMYDYDASNGAMHPISFFLHRLLYETSTSTLEICMASVLAYLLLQCNASALRMQTIITLMVAYYNTIVALFTLVYTTGLSRPEARSVSFFLQALIGVMSGIWIKRGDTVLYDALSWIEYLNPTYWILQSVINANVAGAGDCVLVKRDAAGVETCRAWQGDLVLAEARIDKMDPTVGLAFVIVIWIVLRLAQLALLVRDVHRSKVAGISRVSNKAIKEDKNEIR
eukprot:jgi/Hompol1/861/HPOL_004835-RA